MRRERDRELIAAAVVALATAVLGILLGLGWYLAAPPLPLKKVEGGLAYLSPNPEQQVAQDGWFTILGLVFGLVAAVLVWVIFRRWRGPIQLFAVALGAAGAGYLAWLVGREIGLNAYRELVAAAPLETIVSKPIDLSAAGGDKICLPDRCVNLRSGDILIPALGAAIGYSLLAGWSRWPSLRRHEEAEPALSSAQEWGQAGPEWPEQPGSR